MYESQNHFAGWKKTKIYSFMMAISENKTDSRESGGGKGGEWESSWADKVLYCGCGGSRTICACQNSSNCTFKLVNSFVNYALQFLNNLS